MRKMALPMFVRSMKHKRYSTMTVGRMHRSTFISSFLSRLLVTLIAFGSSWPASTSKVTSPACSRSMVADLRVSSNAKSERNGDDTLTKVGY